MSLEFSKLVSEVEAMGAALARRAGELSEMLPDARGRLQAIGLADDELREKIKRAGVEWPGAIPTDEPVDAAFPLPPHPPRANILGADGSQIYPDRHGSALYFLINVGSILYPHGTDQAPLCQSSSSVFYEEADLYGETEGLISTAVIDGLRDIAELAELARLAAAKVGVQTLSLMDNGLMLWFALQARVMTPRVERIIEDQIRQFSAVQRTGACLAGFVGRPRNSNVLHLLELARRSLESITRESLRTLPFRGLTDRSLFESVLKPGERSALFVNASPEQILRKYRQAGHEMYFFYLNCGRPGKSEVARVEVPQWVALDPNRLAFVHAAIVEQCRVPDGFPYVLVRAHELAVVTMEERRAMDEMVQGALLRQGLRSAISQKAQTKQWTGARRRHRL